MFKKGDKIIKLTSSGAANFRNTELVFRNNIIKVTTNLRGYLFETYFHLFNWFVCISMSLDMMSDPLLYERNEMTFGVLSFGLLFSFLVRLGFGLRAKIKSFDLDAGVFYVANFFKKNPPISIAEIDKLYLIRFHNSSTNNSYNGYEFSLITKSGATYLLMNHSDFYSMKNEIKKLADILGVPFEILVAGDIYKDSILE